VRIVGIFERLTGVYVKDCIVDDKCVYFLIDPNQMGLVIGKNGENIRNIKNLLGKDVKVFEYGDTAEKVIRNMIKNVKDIEINNGVITITIPPNEKSVVIGKNGRNIKIIKKFLQRHFHIKKLRLK
jgi:N utilization substance protein A